MTTLPLRRAGDSCLHDALTELLGRDAGLPDAVPIEENETICARLGLVQFSGKGRNIEIDTGTPVVMIMHTRETMAHAMYVAGHRVGAFLAWNTYPVLAVIVKAEDVSRVCYATGGADDVSQQGARSGTISSGV